MGKKGKRAQAGKPKKLTPKDIGKRLNALVTKLEDELKGADLFAPLPPTDDCAICLEPLPRNAKRSLYQSCCGKLICGGCDGDTVAFVEKQNERNSGKKDKQLVSTTCPFCRAPEPINDEEYIRRLEARFERNDHRAALNLGAACQFRDYGGDAMPKDELKALSYYLRAVELGSSEACNGIGNICREGEGVSVNTKQANLFYLVSALRGCISGRHDIGICQYYGEFNHEEGIRHWKVSAEAGHEPSLNELKAIYNANRPGKQYISKDYLEMVYRVCHDAQEEEVESKRFKC